MNKRQLVDRMSSESGLTMKQSEKALNGLIDVIHTELSSGGNVSLIGFGVFFVADRKNRKTPVFKAEPALKWAVDSR